jgi:hypothetical protein
MTLLEPTRALLRFLNQNAGIRARIAAPDNKTLLYAGNLIRPAWREIADIKRRQAALWDKVTLDEVLGRIAIDAAPHADLLAWAESIQPWHGNGFIAWRALSGIFAANARGKVSFLIGSGVQCSAARDEDNKVFAATEIAVLARNPNIDPTARDVLAYYQRCLLQGQTNMNFGYIAD